MSKPIEITMDNHKNIIAENDICLVDFWAPWCGPCRMLAPVLDELAKESNGRYAICKCNVDEEQELATTFGVRAIPTMIIFKEGEHVETIVGPRSKTDLEGLLARLV